MTPPLPRSVPDRLADAASACFESALVDLRVVLSRHAEDACDVLFSACRAIADADVLDSMERRRRVDIILSPLTLADDEYRLLAARAKEYPAEVRNAIAGAVPARFRGLAYGLSEPAMSASVSDVEATTRSKLPAELADAVPPEGVVLLLGNAKDHEHNMRLLKKGGWVTQRASTVEDFNNLLSDDVCAIIVAKSWWSYLPAKKHAENLDSLLSFSSFSWLKINTDGLSVNNIVERYRQSRFSDPSAARLNHCDSHNVTDPELSYLRSSSGIAQDASQARIYPSDIPVRDGKLIVGAAKAYIQERNSTDRQELRDLSAKLIPGGKSDTLLIHISCDGRSLPFIAKVGNVGMLREELERFHSFIAPHDRELDPQLHFHQDRAAILFKLVADCDNDLDAAPTLHDIVDDTLYADCGGPTPSASESQLETLLKRVIRKLIRLNSQPPSASQFASWAWVDLTLLRNLQEANISWRLLPLRDGADPLICCDDAEKYLKQLEGVSVVHGDLHLRNVLVRNFNDPHLIDYAYAGPGHPCFDLVRLECALLFRALRMTDEEEVVRELMVEVGQGMTFDDVQTAFPTLTNGIGNRVAIKASIEARKACLELLQNHDADEAQYHAMKLMISCQSLALPECQTGIARAAVSAAAQLFVDSRQLVVSD